MKIQTQKLKDIIYWGAWRVNGGFHSPRIVLMYHSVSSDPVLGHLSVSENQFRRQLDHLEKHYSIRSVEEVFNKDNPPGAAITFDDGYAHLLDTAVPLLVERKIAASFYVPSGLMGKNMRTSYGSASVMSASDVRSLRAAGFLIGSHSVSHPFLPACSPEEVVNELTKSKSELEQVLGESIQEFAYPKGGYNRQIIEAVENAAYARAVTVISRSIAESDSPFEIPRSGVYRGTSFSRFRFNLSSAGDRFSRLKKLGVQSID